MLIYDIAHFLHTFSLALWFGGLFGYVLIVWPSIIETEQPGFPRAQLSSIALRTAPWIYLAMITALVTAVVYFFGSLHRISFEAKLLYMMILVLLIANNVYGSVISWPRMMLSPNDVAKTSWKWFYLRMAISLLGGLLLLCIAIFAT